MNKTEVISQVVEMTGIDPVDCTKVLDAFEETGKICFTKTKN